MSNHYDFIVIGAGISGCTFASSLNKRFPSASILLVDQGRRIGGRSTTRKSRKNLTLEYDHGLPSINFSKNISPDLLTFISPLIKSKKLIDITNSILHINESGEMYELFTNEKIYRSVPSMISFCKEIIDQSINPKNINFLFKTLIRSITYINNKWELAINSENCVTSKNLVLSSSLLAHPRCLEILKINSLPLRDAFLSRQDWIVESLLRNVSMQQYLKRKNYIMYVNNFELAKSFDRQYLQICFSKSVMDKFYFERIVFQRQRDGSIIIVLHCCYTNYFIDINFESLIKALVSIFSKHTFIVNLLLHATLFDTMNWRASQPINNLLSKDLQWSSMGNIGFCGDWFDLGSHGPVETAMNSSIRLSKLIM